MQVFTRIHHVWRSEYNRPKLLLFFHYMGSRDRMQVVRVGKEHLSGLLSCWLRILNSLVYACVCVCGVCLQY